MVNVMDKQEFLDILRISLNGKVPYEVLNDSMSYYEEYINTEVRMGKTQEQVMETLGDPRLIARTIVQTKGVEQDEPEARYRDTAEDAENAGTENMWRKIMTKVPGWVWSVLFIALIVLVVTAAFRLFIFFLPVIVVVAVVIFLFNFFNGGSR